MFIFLLTALKFHLYTIVVTAWISALVSSSQIFLLCLIIFQILVEVILSKSASENIESLFTLINQQQEHKFQNNGKHVKVEIQNTAFLKVDNKD